MPAVLVVLRDLVVVLSGITGLAFGIYKYIKSRVAQANLQIDLGLDIHKLSRNNLLSITIVIRNLGKAAAYVGPSKIAEAVCSICKIPRAIEQAQVTWSQMQNNVLIPQIQYLAEWLDYYPDEPFIFEPNAIESYTVIVCTKYRGPVWIRTEIVDDDDYRWQVDRVYVLK